MNRKPFSAPPGLDLSAIEIPDLGSAFIIDTSSLEIPLPSFDPNDIPEILSPFVNPILNVSGDANALGVDLGGVLGSGGSGISEAQVIVLIDDALTVLNISQYATITYVDALVAGLSSTLADLTDVNLTTPTTGQYLRYNAGTGKWTNATINYTDIVGSPGAGSFVDLTSAQTIDGHKNFIGSVTMAGNGVWNSGNDGSGSGLDSDLLDGQHGSYYTDIVARLGYTPLNSGSYTASDVLSKLLTVDGIGSGINADLLDDLDSAAFAQRGSTNTFTAVNTFNLNATAAPAAFSGTVIHVIQADTVTPRILFDAFSTQPTLTHRRANGTNAAKTALLAGDAMGNMNALGYGATGYSANSRVAVAFLAAENWTDTAQGTRIVFSTTANLTASSAQRWFIENDGSFVYAGGTPTGVSTINAVDYFDNGVNINTIYAPISAPTFSSIVTISSASPELRFSESDALTQERNWRISAAAGDFYLQALSDDYSSASNPIIITRTGTTIDSIQLVATALTWGGNTLWSSGNDGTGSGLDADLLDGYDSLALAYGGRAQRLLTGGGTITVDASGYVGWSTRFIIISGGRGTSIAPSGYFDIVQPTSGTITGLGGAADTTATAAGIQLSPWQALYYIIPLGSTNASNPANFRVVSYTSNLDIPAHWVLICARNGDAGSIFYFNNGIQLGLSDSYTAGTVWNSANDGSGSGLDADLWDGNNFATYLNQPLLTTSTPTFEILYVNNKVQSIGTYPTMEWYQTDGATDQKYWRIIADGAQWSLQSVNDAYNTASDLFTITRSGMAGTNIQFYGNTIWHAGNDGAGSGLDSDLLDGLNSSAFAQLAVANTFTQPITARLNVTAGPSLPAGTVLHLIGADATQSRMFLDVFGSNAAFLGRRANGTNASPSAVALNDVIFSFGGFGYGATAYGAAASALGTVVATENFTDTARGGKFTFRTTANGTTSLLDRWHMDQDGSFRAEGLGATGNGTVNATNLFVNGVNINTLYSGVVGGGYWHAGNDGAGSGLDADLWDGNNFATYLNQPLLTTSSVNFGQIVSSALIYATNGFSATSGSAYEPQLNLTNTNNDNTAGYVIFNKNPADTTMTTGDAIGTILWQGRGTSSLGQGGALYSLYAGTRGTNWVAAHIYLARYGTDGVYRQTTFNANGGIVDDLIGNLWGSSNDGSGSGLDADLLDGYNIGTTGAAVPLMSGTNTWTGRQLFTNDNTTVFNRPVGDYLIQLNAADVVRGYIGADATYSFRARNTGGTPLISAANSSGIVELFAADATNGPIRILPTTSGLQHFDGAGNYRWIEGVRSDITGNVNDWILYNNAGGETIRAYHSTRVVNFPVNITIAGGTNWHAGNDGAGSGLDADLLDGVNGADYAKWTQASMTFTASSAVQFTTPSITVFTTGAAGIIISSNYAYLDHRDADGPTDAKNWRLEAGSGQLGWYLYNDAYSAGGPSLYMNRSGTTPTALTWHGTSMTIAGSTVWHAGNDGAGSGLDADLLDGLNSNAFVRNNNGQQTFIGATAATYQHFIILSPSDTGANKPSLYFTQSAAESWTISLYDGADSNGLINIGSSSFQHNGSTVWTAAIDGAGSGLDADLLDGLNASSAASASTIVARDGNGHIFNNYINTTDDTTSGPITYVMAKMGDNYLRSADATKLATFLAGQQAGAAIGFANYNTEFGNTRVGGKRYSGDSSTGTNSPGGTWWFLENYRHNNGTNSWGTQVAWGWEDNANRLKQRNVTAGTWSAWVSYWNDNNDGSGSGLDADFLDGYHESSFWRASVNRQGDYYIARASSSNDAFGGLEIRENGLVGNTFSTASYAPGINFHWGSIVAARLYMNASGQFVLGGQGDITNNRRDLLAATVYSNGNVVWHPGNDGAGSGLDADTIDGVNSVDIVYGVSGYGGSGNVGNMNTASKSGFYVYDTPTNTPTGTWTNWLNIRGALWGDGSQYGHQLAFNLFNTNMYLRNVANNVWSSWATMWHSLNDGAGSGLDADLLDGINSAGFIQGATGVWNTDAGGTQRFYFAGGGRTYYKSPDGHEWRHSDDGARATLDTSGNFVATGNVSAYSDIKLKTNLVQISNASEKLASLIGYTYTRIDTGECQSGLIAQEVEKVLPEVVREDDYGIKTVAYGNMMGLVVEAFKEMQDEIKALKAEIEILKAR